MCYTYTLYIYYFSIKLVFTSEVKFRVFTALDLCKSSEEYIVTKVYLLSCLQVHLIIQQIQQQNNYLVRENRCIAVSQ